MEKAKENEIEMSDTTAAILGLTAISLELYSLYIWCSKSLSKKLAKEVIEFFI